MTTVCEKCKPIARVFSRHARSCGSGAFFSRISHDSGSPGGTGRFVWHVFAMRTRTIIAGVLGVSVVLNVLGAAVTARFLEERGGVDWVKVKLGLASKAQKLDSVTYTNQIDIQRAIPVRPGEVVFVGDSLTASYPWAERFTGLPVRNFGIGADNTVDVLNRLDAVIERQPDAMFLMIGTNDHTRSPEEIAANIRSIVERMHAESAHTVVVLQSILPERNGEAPAKTIATNALLADVAAETGALWVDLHDKFVDNTDGMMAAEYTTDGVHLSPAGYSLWLDELEPLVYRLHTVQRQVAILNDVRAIAG